MGEPNGPAQQPSVGLGRGSYVTAFDRFQLLIPSQNRIEVNRDKTRFADYIEHILWLSPNDRFSRFACETSRGISIGNDKIFMTPFPLDVLH